ncbi:site-specific integrase [Mycolicibacterium goodii]|uniref:tyrosine-type recombinase/integrase n=1 Tax=Mycolicibacterium goodii TaxID=134601 RepID=UPI001BDC88E6|nr:site-specific integrase [Mycolicibacterium goodii]MBU8819900.1 site-specific integrase [Mycolicibacterium goodii]
MAYMKVVDLKQQRRGKPVKRYVVVWREPVRDRFGKPVPLNPDHPTGPKRTRDCTERFDNREAAEARRDELNAAKHTTGTSALSEQRKAGELPFGHYARAWLDAQAVKVSQGKLKQRTVDEYDRLLRCYVLEEFGGMAVAAISPAHCERFLAALVRQSSRQGDRDPLTPGTVKHAWDMLRRVLVYAMRQGAITNNPTERVDFSASRATGDREGFEHHPLTAEQIGRLSAAVAGNPPDPYDGPDLPAYPVYALMVEFMAYTGLRASEVMGLEVQDLQITTRPGEPARGIAHVHRTKERKAGEWVTGTPKSKKSRRTVPLPAWLAERMAGYLRDVHRRPHEPSAPLWPNRKNGGGYRAKGERYPVPLDWSEPVAIGTFYDTILKPALEAVGLPASRPALPATATAPAIPATRGVRLHDLRHTFAVLQLSAGVHFMQVSKWLGHSTFTLTLDVYGDYIPEQDGGALNTLPEPPAPEQPADLPSNVVSLFGRQTS